MSNTPPFPAGGHHADPDEASEELAEGNLQDHVMQLAQVFADPQSRESYLREAEKKETAAHRKQRAAAKDSGAAAHQPMDGLFSELLANAFAHAGSVLLCLALLVGVGAGVWKLTARHNTADSDALVTQTAKPAPPPMGPSATPTTLPADALVRLANSAQPASMTTSASATAVSRALDSAGPKSTAHGAASLALKSGKLKPASAGAGKHGGAAAPVPAAAQQPGAGQQLPSVGAKDAAAPGTAEEAAQLAKTATAQRGNSPDQLPEAKAQLAALSTQPAVPSTAKPAAPDASMADLPPDLKKLWIEGADAKHRGDYAGARRAWKTALAIDPRHYGFQQSIDKLPAGK